MHNRMHRLPPPYRPLWVFAKPLVAAASVAAALGGVMMSAPNPIDGYGWLAGLGLLLTALATAGYLVAAPVAFAVLACSLPNRRLAALLAALPVGVALATLLTVMS
jgi:hypothetical protein